MRCWVVFTRHSVLQSTATEHTDRVFVFVLDCRMAFPTIRPWVVLWSVSPSLLCMTSGTAQVVKVSEGANPSSPGAAGE